MLIKREAYLENNHAEFWIDDGILCIVYKPNLKMTIEVAKKIVADRLKVTDNIPRPLLTDARNFVSIDNATMKYFKTKESVQYVSAGAFLIDNYLARLATNIFLNIDKPPIPAKVFTDRDKAIKWLQQFKFLS